MLLAMISLGVFAIPIIIGAITFIIGIVALIISIKFREIRIFSIIATCVGFATAMVPIGILAFLMISDRIKTQAEYNALPGKVEVDANLDKSGFVVDGVSYKQLFGFEGRDLKRTKTDSTLVYGIYTHKSIDLIETDCPYDLYYTDMFSSVYCNEDEYDLVIEYYDNYADTSAEIKDRFKDESKFTPVAFDFSEYNVIYHKYHPKARYDSLNMDYIDTISIPIESKDRSYNIRTHSSDSVYNTETKILIKENDVYVIFSSNSERAIGIQLDEDEAQFFLNIINSYE